MMPDKDAPTPEGVLRGGSATERELIVEGPHSDDGEITLQGEFVAGHDLHVHTTTRDAGPRFLLVDRDYLEHERKKVKKPFVARSPEWADVIHGADSELRFIERDKTSDLLEEVRTGLLSAGRSTAGHGLEILSVLGSPGAGKSTLVRRVAAVLVMGGECVVADFGLNTDRVRPDEVAGVVLAIEKLAQQVGLPVIVLLDDPFFADSGWTEVLRNLGRRPGSGASILLASPEFLFRRQTHPLRGKQINLRTFELEKPTKSEARTLARLHHRELPETFDDQELLVLAMESAVGVSFDEIVGRIWVTLNDGSPIDPATDPQRAAWPVLAYMVVSYLHRIHVRCPETLLRRILSATLDGVTPEYPGAALNSLVTSDGWHIFSVQDSVDENGRSLTVIGAAHALIAEETWRLRPLRNIDVANHIVNESVFLPEATNTVAQLIMGLQRSPITAERNLARRTANRWGRAKSEGTLNTTMVCTVVRALRSSRQARLPFRQTLRDCLNADDHQSWLAAWQLLHLTSSSAHPQETEMLTKVSLPWTLKRGDLSEGVAESAEIAKRYSGSIAAGITDRLVEALQGDLDWQPHPRQVAWLLDELPSERAVKLLPQCTAFLERDLSSERTARIGAGDVAAALLKFVASNPTISNEQALSTVEIVLDWLAVSEEVPGSLSIRLFEVVEVFPRDPVSSAILSRVVEELGTRPAVDDALCIGALQALQNDPELHADAPSFIWKTYEWLLERPEFVDSTWNTTLTTLWRISILHSHSEKLIPEAIAWLMERPEASETALSAALTALWQIPTLHNTAKELVPKVIAWLMERPEANEATWSAAIKALWQVSTLHGVAEELVPEVFAWLMERPEANEATWSSAFTALWRIPTLETQAEPLIRQGMTWLFGRPEPIEGGWSSAITALWRMPVLHNIARQRVPEVIDRFLGRTEAMQGAWTAIFIALWRVPSLRGPAAQLIPRITAWIKVSPEERDHTHRELLDLKILLDSNSQEVWANTPVVIADTETR